MEEYRKRFIKPEVLFEGDIKSYSEAGALLIKRMIEVDLPKMSFFPENHDPYKWLSKIFNKSDKTLRGWVYDWEGHGKKISIFDFFCLVSIVGSGRANSLLNSLSSNLSPEDQEKQYIDTISMVAKHVRNLADNLDKMSEERNKERE